MDTGRKIGSRLRRDTGRSGTRTSGRLSPILLGLCLGVQCTLCARDALAACIDCHNGIESIAVGDMAEQIQRIGRRHGDPSACVVCHGGDPAADDKDSAHQGAPTELAEAGGPQYFYPDPGDMQVADRTCGLCHEGYAERGRKSVMSTEAEAIGRDLCSAAWEKKTMPGSKPRLFGRYAIIDEDGPEPATGSPAYKSLMNSLIAKLPEHYPTRLLEVPPEPLGPHGHKGATACRSCHGGAARSRPHVSCSACHIRYGTYLGGDPTIDGTKPDSPLVHRIQGTGEIGIEGPGKARKTWSGIPRENCFRCHFDPRLAGTNGIGDAFVHYGVRHDRSGRGLLCQDCHTTIEMHGDGNITATNAAQTEIRCEDCHGTIRQLPWELPLGYGVPEGGITGSLPPRGTATGQDAVVGRRYPVKDGYLLTSRGNPFGNLVRRMFPLFFLPINR